MAEIPDPQIQALAKRVVELEQRSRLEGFARFYAAAIVVLLALSFTRIYEPTPLREGGNTYDFGNLWKMTTSSGAAGFGLVLFVALLVLLAVGAFGARPQERTGVAVGIAILSGVIAAMILLKPDTGDFGPPLTETGAAGVGSCFGLGAVAILHAVLAARGPKSGAE